MSPAFGNRSPMGQLQTTLGERYRVLRSLGGGRMTETFRATDGAKNRDVIVKVLVRSLAEHIDPTRFTAEMARAAAITHPNCAPVVDCACSDEVIGVVQPAIQGESLRSRLVWGPLSVGETIAVLRDVARALDAVHAAGIVHADVKPENIFCTGDAVIVTDIGIASAVMHASALPTSTLTRTGIDVGSPTYFAPEQANGDNIDARADWYAVGVMAFEMLTGLPPFQSPTDAGMLVEHATVMPPDIVHRRTGLPASLSALVMQWLSKDPSRRPADLDLIERALDAAVQGPYVGPVAVWQPPVTAELRNVRTPPPMAVITPPKPARTRMRFVDAVVSSLNQSSTPNRTAANGASGKRAPRRTDAAPAPTRSPRERQLAIIATLATVLVVAASTFGMVQLFRFDGDAPEPPPAAAPKMFQLSASKVPAVAVRPIWIVALPEPDARWQALLTAARTTVRAQLPGAALVPLAQSDTALADTTAMRALAFARSAIAVSVVRTTQNQRSDLNVLVMTDSATTSCRYQQPVNPAVDTTAQLIELQQRWLGMLAYRHNVVLQQRLPGTPGAPELTHLCRFVRYDALMLLASARADSLRPALQRVAELDRALALDSTLAEARAERTRLVALAGNTAAATAVAGIHQERARADVSLLQQIERDPAGAFTMAKRAAATGEASTSVWALAALAAGHPREVLEALDVLGTRIDTVAGALMGPDMKTALRADAQYMMGHDSLALATVLPALNLNASMLSSVALPAAAALGDTMRWNGLLRGARVTSADERLSALLLAGDIASANGRDSVAQRWYRQALAEGEPLVARASARVQLQVGIARRRTHNFAGADSLLAPLESQSDSTVARQARLTRALLAVERHDENAIVAAERWMREDVDQRRRWDAALNLARLYVLNGNLPAAAQFVRTALEFGMPRLHRTATARIGDLRAEPELKSLLSTAEGRALIIPAN